MVSLYLRFCHQPSGVRDMNETLISFFPAYIDDCSCLFHCFPLQCGDFPFKVGISTSELRLPKGHPSVGMIKRSRKSPTSMVQFTHSIPLLDAGKGLFDFCSYKEGLCNLHAERWSHGSGKLAKT